MASNPCYPLLTCVVLLALGCDTQRASSVDSHPTPGGSAASAGASSSSRADAAVPMSTRPSVRPPPIDGAPLYQRYCALCHGKDATGYAADNAPSLISRTFLESAPDGFLARGIRLGRPGTAMAAYSKHRGGPLEDAEIRAIVRFLRGKGPAVKRLPYQAEKGNAARGARLFDTHCVKCHGTEKQRGEAPALYNPEFLAAATPAFLRYAIVNGRPPTEMAAFGKTLSDAEIDDLVAHLRANAPGPRRPEPSVDVKALAKLPVVMNPKGARPNFTLREERFVSIEQVKKAFDAKQRLIVIDARAASDFLSSHVTGAISNPYYDTSGLDRIPKDGTWVVAYCACPHHASGEVVDELRRRGYKNTAVMDEGFFEWKRLGYPVAEKKDLPGFEK